MPGEEPSNKASNKEPVEAESAEESVYETDDSNDEAGNNVDNKKKFRPTPGPDVPPKEENPISSETKIRLVLCCLLHTWFTSYGAVFEVLRNGKLLHSFKRWETKEINKWVKSESTDHLMPNLQMMKVSNSPIVACGPRFFSLFLPRFNFFLMHLMQNFTDI